jgi:hypothetical protein
VQAHGKVTVFCQCIIVNPRLITQLSKTANSAGYNGYTIQQIKCSSVEILRSNIFNLCHLVIILTCCQLLHCGNAATFHYKFFHQFYNASFQLRISIDATTNSLMARAIPTFNADFSPFCLVYTLTLGVFFVVAYSSIGTVFTTNINKNYLQVWIILL